MKNFVVEVKVSVVNFSASIVLALTFSNWGHFRSYLGLVILSTLIS